MKRFINKKSIFILIILCFSLVLICSCQGKNKEIYEITFVYNNG